MNPPDGFGSEDPVRDVMQGLIPSIAPPLDLIDTRASSLRRAFRLRMAGLTAALVIATVATAGALTGGGRKNAVEVENRHGHRSKVVVSPTTSRHGAITRPTSVTTAFNGFSTTVPGFDVPTTNPPAVSPAPGRPIVVPVPTTTTRPASRPTPPTTAPAPTYPALPATHTRMTVVLDDAGLHAPATFAAGGYVEILFLDRRSHPTPMTGEPNGTAYLFSEDGTVSVERWDGSLDELLSFDLSVGTILFHASDGSCHCTIAGASATVTIVP